MPKTPHIYLLLFTLYWAQGLPVGFMTQALPVILRSEGLSLAQIGGFGLLMLPWSIKIFWAPWVDRYGWQRLGHYRSWILITQLCSIGLLVILSFLPIQLLNQPLYLILFFIILFVMNVLVATQDMGTDGLAVNILHSKQMAWGNSLQVLGSRFGFIVGGGALLWALDWLSWQTTLLLLAFLVLCNTIPILLYQETAKQKIVERSELDSHSSFTQRMKQYLHYFTHRRELKAWLGVLLTFKIADGLSGPILKPLLVDIGLSYTQIGIYITMFGACAAVVGAIVGAWSLKYFSHAQALISFSLLKGISLFGYTVLAYMLQKGYFIEPKWVYMLNAFEDMLAAMLLVLMLSLIMFYSRKASAATDFTFQVAIMATVSGLLYSVSGWFGDSLGYAVYLMIISAIFFITIVPILIWSKNKNL